MPIMASKIQRGIILKTAEWSRLDTQAEAHDETRAAYLRRLVLDGLAKDEAKRLAKEKKA